MKKGQGRIGAYGGQGRNDCQEGYALYLVRLADSDLLWDVAYGQTPISVNYCQELNRFKEAIGPHLSIVYPLEYSGSGLGGCFATTLLIYARITYLMVLVVKNSPKEQLVYTDCLVFRP